MIYHLKNEYDIPKENGFELILLLLRFTGILDRKLTT
jgi:hypothetical protein